MYHSCAHNWQIYGEQQCCLPVTDSPSLESDGMPTGNKNKKTHEMQLSDSSSLTSGWLSGLVQI